MLNFLLSALLGVPKVPWGSKRWQDRSPMELVDALIEGDGTAFTWLVERYWKSMERVAKGIVGEDTVAQEVVQDVWVTIHKEISKFRKEASLKNWMFRILVNKAKRVGQREARTIAFSQMGAENEDGETNHGADEFTPSGRWRSPVLGWQLTDPQEQTINKQGLKLLSDFLETLPEKQRVIVTLRDVEGLDSKEVCELLDVTESNQRVLLHRGRTALRRLLENAERDLD